VVCTWKGAQTVRLHFVSRRASLMWVRTKSRTYRTLFIRTQKK
jgi:hypothetical protein